MSQERRLMRRLERQGGNAQTRGGLYLPQGAYTPQDEQDAKRDRLAERLLEIGLEDLSLFDFSDTAPVTVQTGDGEAEQQPQVTVSEWYLKHAHAALAAAEVIYPDVLEAGRNAGMHFPKADGDTREHVTDGSPCWCGPATESPVPEAAQAGEV